MWTTQERSAWQGWQKFTDFIRLLGWTVTVTLTVVNITTSFPGGTQPPGRGAPRSQRQHQEV